MRTKPHKGLFRSDKYIVLQKLAFVNPLFGFFASSTASNRDGNRRLVFTSLPDRPGNA